MPKVTAAGIGQIWSYILAVVITAVLALVWYIAFIVYPRTIGPTRGEVLMVLPCLTINMFPLGMALAFCTYLARKHLRFVEQLVLAIVVLLALAAFPVLIVLDIVGVL
jgi:hypothetical protein